MDKKTVFTISLLCMMLCAGSDLFAQNQQQGEQLSMEDMAIQQAEKLGESLKLEDWQVFYVDSTLRHDYVALDEEMRGLRDSKVSNTDIYMSVQDKWMQQIDDTFKKFFNTDQWERYQKMGAAKAQKARDKRKAKAVGAPEDGSRKNAGGKPRKEKNK